MVSLSDAAVQKVSELLAQASVEAPGVGLRVGVRSGGCSGFQYALTLDAPGPGDLVSDHAGVRVICEPASVRYVSGAVVDYVGGLQEAGFRVENPNVVASCGCGSSFRVADDGACE